MRLPFRRSSVLAPAIHWMARSEREYAELQDILKRVMYVTSKLEAESKGLGKCAPMCKSIAERLRVALKQ